MWHHGIRWKKRPNAAGQVSSKDESSSSMSGEEAMSLLLEGHSPAEEGRARAEGAMGGEPGEAGPTEAGQALSAWRMGLVVTASALCGGIAVVLWNRRLLTKMREVAPVARSRHRDQQGHLWEDDI